MSKHKFLTLFFLINVISLIQCLLDKLFSYNRGKQNSCHITRQNKTEFTTMIVDQPPIKHIEISCIYQYSRPYQVKALYLITYTNNANQYLLQISCIYLLSQKVCGFVGFTCHKLMLGPGRLKWESPLRITF